MIFCGAVDSLMIAAWRHSVKSYECVYVFVYVCMPCCIETCPCMQFYTASHCQTLVCFLNCNSVLFFSFTLVFTTA